MANTSGYSFAYCVIGKSVVNSSGIFITLKIFEKPHRNMED